ncbi:membrane protein [Sphaerisporangium rufum]|uniref:Membrane protein n=1 Tax=Sphaerisporangium rufum TaxID=1381558 RepID=A0A919R845_9ACTN|nr:LysE family translocator [Sphaerisporangium rufum]GII79040.1 membrane protein [Sphaerisporangium rufum]
MNMQLFTAFLLAALVIQVTPGPGMLFIVALGMAGGRRAGWAAACGAAAGMLVHTCAVALGLGAVLRAAPMAMDLLRFGGAAYLLWLAVRAFRTSDGVPAVPDRAAPERLGPVFVRGLVNNLANPKIVLFYLAFLPQFVDPVLGRETVQLFVLGLAFLALGLAVDLILGGAAGGAGRRLLRHRAARRWLDRLAGTVYGVLAARLILSDPA